MKNALITSSLFYCQIPSHVNPKHPEWGSYVYPASIFTTAPEEIVLKVINVKPNVG